MVLSRRTTITGLRSQLAEAQSNLDALLNYQSLGVPLNLALKGTLG